MTHKKLSVSEARRQFSRLVGGVSRRRTCVAITQHGKEQAALIGMQEYRELTQKALAFDQSRKGTGSFTLKGSLDLCCSPQELIEEMRKIRAQWTESTKNSTEELARELARK